MKLSLYLHYILRSLRRGGLHTLLAIFCIAIGVMSIVALQLVGLTITNAYTSNVRALNGGDISVSTQQQNVAFKPGDLAYFDQLKQSGTISTYTPIVTTIASFGNAISYLHHFSVEAVDPGTFPVVTPPPFTDPANGTFANLLKNHQVIVSEEWANTYNKHIGDSIDIDTMSQDHGTRALHVRISGIIPNTGMFAQAGKLMLISTTDFQAAAPTVPLPYDLVNVTTSDQAHTDAANGLIEGKFYYATTQTAANLQANNQVQADLTGKFLELVGILALLIGGIGIVNTMQVMLTRRKTEIAMLKTLGYRRIDLYLLFGGEAGILGLSGGILGAATATGIGYLLLLLLQQAFGQRFPIFSSAATFSLDWNTIVGGVAIGFFTALIFGLMPIVKAANIRPLHALRALPENRPTRGSASTLILLLLLSILFCFLTISIMKNVVWGISVVYGTFLFLALLSGLITVLVLIVSAIPVPEHFRIKSLLWVAPGIVLSVVLFSVQPLYGGLVLALTLLIFALAWLPATWKACTRMALRNIGRQRTRTTTTMQALFIGVFAIGIVLVVGQGLRTTITTTLTQALTFNIQVVSTGAETKIIQADSKNLPGYTASQQTIFASVQPLALNGRPLKDVLPTGSMAQSSSTSMGNANAVEHMSSIEGYNVADTGTARKHNLTITNGRALNAHDLGTDNVLVGSRLVQQGPLNLKLGSTLTLSSADGKTTRILTVVGAYNQGASDFMGDILAPGATALALSPPQQVQTITYLNIDSTHFDAATARLAQIVPKSIVYTIADLTSAIGQLLDSIVVALTAIASLSMLAGIIIIANVVALAMLERQRELGILKAVGYTSKTVLSTVLIENGIVGMTAGLLAMLFVLLVANLLGRVLFQSLNLSGGFSVNGWYAIGLTSAMAVLAMAMAALVSWRSVHVRPLMVLRYE